VTAILQNPTSPDAKGAAAKTPAQNRRTNAQAVPVATPQADETSTDAVMPSNPTNSGKTGDAPPAAGVDAAAAKVQPPALLPRPPIPAPPAVTLLPPRAHHERSPLAWRARAYELANSSKPSGFRLRHDFSAAAAETFAAMSQACEQLGLPVDGVSSAAKQLAVRPPESDRILVLFVTEPNGAHNCSVVAGIYPDSKSFKTAIIDTVISKTEAILNEKGML
jgi:hypothetical protein